MTDPTFTTREALEAWAVGVAQANDGISTLGKIRVLDLIRRVTLAHAHLLTPSKGTPS